MKKNKKHTVDFEVSLTRLKLDIKTPLDFHTPYFASSGIMALKSEVIAAFSKYYAYAENENSPAKKEE